MLWRRATSCTFHWRRLTPPPCGELSLLYGGIWRMIDDTDAKILNILQGDARMPNSEIARRLGMAPSAIFERIRKLEARGVIQGYAVRINPHALELGLLAFI